MPSTPANSLNLSATSGVVTWDGTATLTTSSVNQYSMIVGSTAEGVANIAPSATAGIPLVSNGSSANPAFSTAVVAGGGTGATSFASHSVITSGATSTAALNAVGPLTDGQLIIGATGGAPAAAALTQGAGITITNASNAITIAATAASAVSKVAIQAITSTGPYTPTAGMKYCIIEVLGGGGAGGGAAATAAATVCPGGGGGAGEYARGVFSAATIGVSQNVIIGAAGAVHSGTTGGNGGNTSFGTLISAFGGVGGNTGTSAATANCNGGTGGTGGAGGSFRTAGQSGFWGFSYGLAPVLTAGQGGSSQYGAGGQVSIIGVSNQGIAGNGYGSGGGGSCNYFSQSALAGGAGTAGIAVITEYI